MGTRLKYNERTSVETARNGGDDDLNGEEGAHNPQNRLVVVVDGIDTDDVDGRGGSEEDGGGDGFEEEELGAHVQRPLGIEEGDRYEGKSVSL